jgi:2-polyprenyl-3-methyl-5-hydroxy-6-metoxy-1,4-benzoquinol methylase
MLFTMLKYEFIDPDIQVDSMDFRVIESFLKMTDRTQIGWHYISDIAWIYSNIKNWPRDFKILDAGGGAGGPVQFLMAELGFHVTNIDLNLNNPAFAYQKRYQSIYEVLPSFQNTGYGTFLAGINNKEQRLAPLIKMVKKLMPYKLLSAGRYAIRHEKWKKAINLSNKTGTVNWFRGNLCGIPEVPDNTFDAVVSLSALEHIQLDNLKSAVEEIKRVVKPNGRWAVTTSGTEKTETWFHEQSQGNCFSCRDLERMFGATPQGAQNPQEALVKYQRNSYLQKNLAKFYFKSGKYGMPWGKWDPKYIPVGIFK